MHRKKVVVVSPGYGNEMLRAAIAKLLQDDDIFVDGRNTLTMTSETIKGVVAVARRWGNPVFVQQGVLAPYLKALEFKGYWTFVQKGAGFSFWFIDGATTAPKEHPIAV